MKQEKLLDGCLQQKSNQTAKMLIQQTGEEESEIFKQEKAPRGTNPR